MMKSLKLILISLITITLTSCVDNREIIDISGDMFNGIKIRPIGPGTYAGRISEILVHPDNDSIIYFDFICAWITVYNKKDDIWIKVTEVDNFHETQY